MSDLVKCDRCGVMVSPFNGHLDRECLVHLRARVAELELAATRMLQASEPTVPETEGMRRASALAKLVGYNPGAQAPLGMPKTKDTDAMERELVRLADLLRIEVLETSPGWQFALFLFQDRDDPQNGHVLGISKDRDRALAAVSRWAWERLEARKTKARG